MKSDYDMASQALNALGESLAHRVKNIRSGDEHSIESARELVHNLADKLDPESLAIFLHSTAIGMKAMIEAKMAIKAEQNKN